MSESANSGREGIWKSGRGGRNRPKGRPLDIDALDELESLLADLPKRQDLLIEYLHRLQDHHGHLGAAQLRALAEWLSLSQAEVYEVASFYAHFDLVAEGETPPPELTIRVCESLSCVLAGANALSQHLHNGVDPAQVRVVRAPCMGRCDQAPALEIGRRHMDRATPEDVFNAIEQKDFRPRIPAYRQLDTALEGGAYTQLKALRNGSRSIEDLQQAIENSGLRGLGGAGFPAARKWGFVREAQGEKILAVNADEGEPGTFKDRLYLERYPHVFLEGMLLAAHAIDASRVYLYLRDEYPVAHAILSHELDALLKAGIIAPEYVELRRGAGAYICGEESAMIESIEGKRGLPRHRPPYVAQRGIFDQPTLVHNVETLYWIACIASDGPEVLNTTTHNGRTGLRSYSLSGRVKNPGVYLLPAGTTIRELIEAGGGMADGHEFKAYQPGGPSSGILPAHLDQVPLDFDTLQEHGSFIGSAAVVVLSDLDSVRDAALNMLKFFEDESCGQCTPCRVGCGKAVQLMEQYTWNGELLEELCTTMADASICGLGQAAPNPIRLVLKHFPKEVN